MTTLILIFLFLFLAASLIALVFSLNTLYSLFKVKVPYVITPDWAIEEIIQKIKPKENSIIYDLGLGDARVLIALKKAFPKIKAVGFEISWWPYLNAKRNIKKSGLNIDLIRKNFYNVKLSSADIIFCFLIDSVMPRLEKKLLAELKPGTLIISYGFTFPNWQPKEVISNPKKPEGSKINIYKK